MADKKVKMLRDSVISQGKTEKTGKTITVTSDQARALVQAGAASYVVEESKADTTKDK